MKSHNQIIIVCPNCKIEVKVPANAVAVQCPKCGEKIVPPYGEKNYGEAK